MISIFQKVSNNLAEEVVNLIKKDGCFNQPGGGLGLGLYHEFMMMIVGVAASRHAKMIRETLIDELIEKVLKDIKGGELKLTFHLC